MPPFRGLGTPEIEKNISREEDRLKKRIESRKRKKSARTDETEDEVVKALTAPLSAAVDSTK